MNDLLPLIGRTKPLFGQDLAEREQRMKMELKRSRVLVIGGAGAIGRAVALKLFSFDPKAMYVADISENNLAELVRDIRSSQGYGTGEFKTLCLDCGAPEFEAFYRAAGPFDYVLNFSALKHVRSEKDPFTLMRMVRVNILNTIKTLDLAKEKALKYFAISTDKAANPVNMMGASKRIMEMFLMRGAEVVPVSTARFANVAFSDGSLLDAFTYRIKKNQPLSAPSDIRRYFITDAEAAILCLLSALEGGNRQVLFPKLSQELNLTTFADIAVKYLEKLGFEAVTCASEEEARARAAELIPAGKYPCHFFTSDTTGEKDFEEFYTSAETVDWDTFHDIGVINYDFGYDNDKLEYFTAEINRMLEARAWEKAELVALFNQMLSSFSHKETNKYLDDRM